MATTSHRLRLLEQFPCTAATSVQVPPPPRRGLLLAGGTSLWPGDTPFSGDSRLCPNSGKRLMALVQDAATVSGALSGTGGADSEETGTTESPETRGNQEEGTLTPGDGVTLKNRNLNETEPSLPTLQQATPLVSTQAESSQCEKVHTTRPPEQPGEGEGAASTETPKDEPGDAITTSAGHTATTTSAGSTATGATTISTGHDATATSAGHVVTMTNKGHDATMTNKGHDATTTSAGHNATRTSAGHDATTTSTGHDATTTSTGHNATRTSAGHNATTTSTGHDATTTSAGHDATTTSAGHDATTTSAGHNATTTSTGHDATTNTGHDATTTSTGHDATTTSTGHDATTTNTGHDATTTNTGHDATMTSTEHDATMTNQTLVTTKTTTRMSTAELTKTALDKELEALLSLASADPPPHDVLMIQSEYNGTTDIVKVDPRLEEPSVTEGKVPPHPLRPATTWTSANLREFKHRMANEKHGLLTVRRGEVMTVRVPTHPDGKRLCWEFATDDYDIGFGIYFDWTSVTSTAVTLQVSESSDEEEEEDAESPWHSREGDVERGSVYRLRSRYGEIMQVYRRDSHREVQAGNHEYPGEGVYLLKLDNSYSLLRNKTLYFHVYYSS